MSSGDGSVTFFTPKGSERICPDCKRLEAKMFSPAAR